MKQRIAYGIGLLAALFVLGQGAFAAIPQTINYQSRLRTSGWVAVTTPTKVSFSLYSALSGGSPLWTETYDQASGACKKPTPDADGYFSVALGGCAAFPVSLTFTDPLFLGVTIESDAEAAPRIKFSSSPYTLNAVRLGTFAGDLANSRVVAETKGTATSGTPGFDSSALTFRGSGWNGSSAQTRDVTIRNIVTSATSSRLGIFNTAGTEIVSITDDGAVGVGVTNPTGAMEVVGDFYADRLLTREGTVFNSSNLSSNTDFTGFTRAKYFLGSASSTLGTELDSKNLVMYENTGTTFLEDAVFSKLVSITNQQIKFASSTLTFPTSTPTSDGQVLSGTTGGILSWIDAGTVSSVGLSLPDIFSVSGSPVTSSGTSTATLVSQATGTVFAAPTSTSGVPTFRALAASDIPDLDASKITSGTFPAVTLANITISGTQITTGTINIARLPSIPTSSITGVFGVSQGGTGLSSYTANGLIFAPSSGVISQVAAGTTGQVLTLVGGVPTWSATSSIIDLTNVNVVIQPDVAGTRGVGSSSKPFGSIFAGAVNATSVVVASGVTTTAFTATGPVQMNGSIVLGDSLSDAITVNGALKITSGTPGLNKILTSDATGNATWATSTAGTLSSVATVLPNIFNVSGSPITGAGGTTTATFATQTVATVFAAPTSTSGVPTFRALAASDIPNLDASQITSGTFPAVTLANITISGTQITTGTINIARLPSIPTSSITGVFGVAQGGTGLSAVGAPGQVLTVVSGAPAWATSSAGTVTSVGVTAPANVFATSSAITSSGNVNITFINQGGRSFLASPADGSTSTPSFRAILAADIPILTTSSIPSLDASKITSGTLAVAQGGTNLSSYTANGLIFASNTSTIGQVAAGTTGQVLTLVGGVPTWSATSSIIDLTNVNVVIQPDAAGGRGVGSAAKPFGSMYANSMNASGIVASSSITTPALQITTGTNLTGKVLTSDNAGNATWQSPVAPICEAPVFVGDKTITGNLSVGGVSSNLIPSAPNTYDLGSAAMPWRSLYMTTSTIHLIGSNGEEIATLSAGSDGDLSTVNKKTGVRKSLTGGGGLAGFESTIDANGDPVLTAAGDKDAVLGSVKETVDVFAGDLAAENLKIATGGDKDVKGKALAVTDVSADGKMATVGFASLTDDRVEPLKGEVEGLKAQLANLQAQFAMLAASIIADAPKEKEKESLVCSSATVQVSIGSVKGSGWTVTGTPSAVPTPAKATPVPPAAVVPPSTAPVAVIPPAPVTPPAQAPSGPISGTQTKVAGRMINVYGAPPSSDMQWSSQGGNAGSSYVTNSAYASSTKSQILSANNFGFSIPANARITSIKFLVTRTSAKGNVNDDTVYVVANNAVVGDNMAAGAKWPSAVSGVAFNAPSNAFSLSAADVNSIGFALGLRAIVGSTDTATVNSVSATVGYTVP